MEFKLIQGAGNEKYIKKCVSLDKKSYSKEYQGDFETYMHIYKTNPNSFIFIVEGEVLIGYSIITPISDIAHLKMLQGNCIDTQSFKYSDFVHYKKASKLYVYSLVIHDSKRNNGLSNILFDSCINQSEKWGVKNKKIDFLFADVVDSKLKRIATKRGFKFLKKTNHNSEIIGKNVGNKLAI